MTTLFSYTVAQDSGAAPNPFHGLCTLALCKPVIRRVARPGDWVVGLGSCNTPQGDLSARVIYAMHVEQCISMAEYDRQRHNWPQRVPDFNSTDPTARLGDCIYDFSQGEPPRQRPGVHDSGNIQNDLGGRHVLLSRDFHYFGAAAIPLPPHLLAIQHRRGHKSRANAPYVDAFLRWIQTLPPGKQGEPGVVLNWPEMNVRALPGHRCAALITPPVTVPEAQDVDCTGKRQRPPMPGKGCGG